MIKVKNKKAIANISIKSLKANKLRNIIAIIAISLTGILFTSLFTMGIGATGVMQESLMRQVGGDGHGIVKYITDEEFNTVKDHPLIDKISYSRILSDEIKNDELIKQRTEFWYHDAIGLELTFIDASNIVGSLPKRANEVIVDVKTLALLGVPLEIGTKFTLDLEIRGNILERDFILSGYWERDPVNVVGNVVASHAYLDEYADELENTYYEDYSLTGAINASIMFENTRNIEDKLQRVITESGYSSLDTDQNFIANNTNWAYLSTGVDGISAIAGIAMLVLIMLTGYLIIYNIFYISITKDIRFYGLLKTIGTTPKQITRIILRQSLVLSCIAIPIGLVIGYFAGALLVPIVVARSAYAGTQALVEPDVLMFIGAGVFTLITVIMSTLKPAKIAAKVSPIEAVRYNDGSTQSKKVTKKTMNGGTPNKMALSNLGRNKKRTALVIISLSLSIIILNSIVTLSNSFDMDKYLATFNDTDFLIGHAEYFSNDYWGNESQQLTERFITAVESQKGFERGGRLYTGAYADGFSVTNPNNTAKRVNKNTQGDYFAQVYGLEGLAFDRLDLIDGEIDIEKLLSGDYLLEGVWLDDHGRPEMEEANYAVGDTLILNQMVFKDENSPGEYRTKEYTVLGHVKAKYYSNTVRHGNPYIFYLPAERYKSMTTSPTSKPALMTYAFNVASEFEADMENFLKEYTNNEEATMHYTSKFTSKGEFESLQSTLLLIGGALSLIVGLIGLLNFANAIITSINTRKREFAMLQSIGMTTKQLQHMLVYEGLFYCTGTALVGLGLSIAFSLTAVKGLCEVFFFTSYNFTILPLLLLVPVLALLGIIIPKIVYSMSNKKSIVERIREAE